MQQEDMVGMSPAQREELSQEELENDYARSLVQPTQPQPEDDSMFVKLLDNVEIVDYFEHRLKGEIWSQDKNKFVQIHPPLLKEDGINGTLAVVQPISDKLNSTTYYDEDEIMEIMYHMLFELDEFFMEKWQEIGLVQNPDLPLVRIGGGHYQLKPRYPSVPTDKDQKYYLKHLNYYDIIEPQPNLAHYNLVRGIIKRIAYATIKKSYRGLTLKQLKTQVNILEQMRTGDYGRRKEGFGDMLKKNPIFK